MSVCQYKATGEYICSNKPLIIEPFASKEYKGLSTALTAKNKTYNMPGKPSRKSFDSGVKQTIDYAKQVLQTGPPKF